MNIPLLSYLVHLIEEVLTKEAPIAGAAAIASAESDPKVQAITTASVAVLAATKNLKDAVNDHPNTPEISAPLFVDK